MKEENYIAKSIGEAGYHAEYDESCKRLLSIKIFLAWIMKDCMAEFQNVSVEEIAEKYIEGMPEISETGIYPDEEGAMRIVGSNTEDVTLYEGTVTYDIRFLATAPESGEPIRLIVNVEAQRNFYPGYPLVKRAIYYCSRLISSQYGTEFKNSEYNKIKKVYSIWICTSPPKERANTITGYRISEEHIIGEVEEPRQNYDLMMAVIFCLGQEWAQKDALGMLNILLSRRVNPEKKKEILERDYHIPMTKEIRKEVSNMCNLSMGIYAEGLADGMEKGLTDGMERGMSTATLNNLKKLIKNLNFSLEKAMQVLEIPETEQVKYSELIRG